jgi:hypothetical protein
LHRSLFLFTKVTASHFGNVRNQRIFFDNRPQSTDDGQQLAKLNAKPLNFKGDFDNSIFGNQMTLATPDFTPK